MAGDLAGTAAAPTVKAASESVAGKVELATAAETTTGTDSSRAVHPAGLKVELNKKAPLGAYVGVDARTGTTYTLVLADRGKLVTCSNTGAITVTIPTNASVAFPVGSQVDVC